MSEPVVNAAALRGWSNNLNALGCDPEMALLAAGLSAHDNARLTDTIPLSAFANFAEYVGTHSTQSSATWLLGLNYNIAELGDVGFAILSAKTLGNALRRFSDHFELLQDTTALEFESNADTATIGYRILDPKIWPRHHDALFTLGIITNIINLAAPNVLEEFEIGFESERRETGMGLSCNQISFGCDTNSITLPVKMLDLKMPDFGQGCDLKSLSQQLAQKRRSVPAQDRLASLIYSRLPLGGINQDDLALKIGMSSRTMRRRLSEGKSSFQQLLDECRMKQAVLEFQARPQHSIAQIALKLGYAEHSNFTRAFTRWAGIPPQRFRTEKLNYTH